MHPQPQTTAPTPRHRWEAPLALVLLAIAGGLLLWRNTFESSIWCDEVYTIMLTQHPAGELIDLTAIDQHPPEYYLLLKAWNKLGRMAGIEPGIAWARFPGFLLWLALVGAAWWAGARVIGGRGGPLLAAMTGISSQAAWAFRNLRDYGLGVTALGICFFLMLWLIDRERRGENRGTEWGWITYAIAAGAALWAHLLTSFVMLLLGLWWMGAALGLLKRRGIRAALGSRFVIGGALAHLAALLAFAPWLLHLGQQMGSLDGGRRDWMTPPTALNLLKVFTLWYPFGHAGGAWPNDGGGRWQVPLGTLSMLAPALAHLLRRNRRAAEGSAAARLALAGLLLGLINATLLWTCDRLDIQHVFHGPRYTMFGVVPWGAGLAGLCLVAGEGRRGAVWAWLLAAPWLAMNLTGTIAEIQMERRSLLLEDLHALSGQLPPPGGPLIVAPSELIPYYRRTLGNWEVRRDESLASMPEGADGVHILRLSLWAQLDPLRISALSALIDGGRIADHVATTKMPLYDETQPKQEALYVLDGLHPGPYRDFLANGLAQVRPRPGVAEIIPATQLRNTDGWNPLELDSDLNAWRWSSAPTARVRFTRPAGPGAVTLRIRGLRQALPTTTGTLQLAFEGAGEPIKLRLGPGWFDREVTFNLLERLGQPVLDLKHPTYRMTDYDEKSQDPRPLGVKILSIDRLSPGAP